MEGFQRGPFSPPGDLAFPLGSARLAPVHPALSPPGSVLCGEPRSPKLFLSNVVVTSQPGINRVRLSSRVWCSGDRSAHPGQGRGVSPCGFLPRRHGTQLVLLIFPISAEQEGSWSLESRMENIGGQASILARPGPGACCPGAEGGDAQGV